MLIVKIAISVLMGLAGLAKLAGAKPIAEQFDEFGLPRPFMYVVGALEVAAAVGVHLGGLAFYASTGSALLMLGAIASHIKVSHPIGQSGPALLVLGLSVTHSVLTFPF